MTNRVGLFALIATITAAAVGGYVALRVGDMRASVSAAAPSSAGSAHASVPAGSPAIDGRIFFRHVAVDAMYGRLAHTQLGSSSPIEFVDSIACEVVHFAQGRGICLAADRGVFTTYEAMILDVESAQPLAKLPLAGIPSRTRVSPDGRRGAFTVFVTGHGYDSVDFSTQTLLLDLQTMEVEADLEDFTVTRDGRQITAPDFNFWGVTFARDSRTFYATLSTAGEHYLIRGDADARTATVLTPGVECPSLSPDEQHVAFKSRITIDGRVAWQIAVLDLATGSITDLSEHRSVDDQLEWLDEEHVLYSMPGSKGSGASTDVWLTRADGRGEPRLLLANAYSPAVYR